jgi:hypothetical protein
MDAKRMVKKGEEIYIRRYKKILEKSHRGEYLAIDLNTEESFLGSSPEKAAQKATRKNPKGFFYLVRIGFAGVYRIGSMVTDADYSII